MAQIRLHKHFVRTIIPCVALAILAFSGPFVAGADQQAPAGKNGRAPRTSLNIVVAEHVLVWDGEIVSWDEAVTELRRQRKAADKPIHPHFYFTNGAHGAGRWDEYKA